MSRLVLATADVDFEQRVRDAFDGELNGPLRYWRDDMIVDPSHAVRELGGRDGKRRVSRVTAVDGMEGETITLSDVFRFEAEPAPEGGVAGALRPTGVRPKLTERLHEAGITLPAELFGAPVNA